MNGDAGIEGFRWLFIIEGLITILCVPLIIAFMPNWPGTAKWLTDNEKHCITTRLEAQASGFTRERASRREILETCFTPRMVAHYLAYVSSCCRSTYNY